MVPIWTPLNLELTAPQAMAAGTLARIVFPNCRLVCMMFFRTVIYCPSKRRGVQVSREYCAIPRVYEKFMAADERRLKTRISSTFIGVHLRPNRNFSRLLTVAVLGVNLYGAILLTCFDDVVCGWIGLRAGPDCASEARWGLAHSG